MSMNAKNNFKELLRYALVGGVATVVDWTVLFVFTEYVFPSLSYGVYLAHVFSFLSGLNTNFFLSNRFVFTAVHQKERGRDWKAFLLFGVIGVIGLLMTELGAWLSDLLFGAKTLLFTVFGLDVRVYLVTKAILTVIVFLWNYLARKILVYDRKGGKAV